MAAMNSMRTLAGSLMGQVAIGYAGAALAQSPSLSKLPKVVYRLGWISFFNDICSEMAYPIIPLFIVEVLHADKTALGWIDGTALALVYFMSAWSGFRSDRAGKRVIFLQAGYLTSGLSKPIFALAHLWPAALGARVLDRFGKGVRTTARDALMADSVDKKDYGRAYGLHQGMDTAGAFVGVIATAFLLWLWSAMPSDTIYRRVFFAAAIPGAVAWVLTLTLKDPPRQVEENGVPRAFKFEWGSLTKAYWRAVLISAIFGLANSSDTFLLLRAGPAKDGGVGLTALFVVLAYAAYNLVFTFLSYPAGKLSDKMGRWPTLFVGWILYAVVYAGFGIANTVSIWIMFIIYGLSIGAVTAVNKALVADLAPKGARGSAIGIFQMVTGVATLVASPVMGIVWDHYGAAAAFDMCAVLALLAAFLIPLTGGFGRKEAAVTA
jgi:MFS family permease